MSYQSYPSPPGTANLTRSQLPREDEPVAHGVPSGTLPALAPSQIHNDVASNDAPSASLLTPEEAARWLHVSRTTMYRLLESRRLPFFRVSRSIRISTVDLQAYLEAGRVGVREDQA